MVENIEGPNYMLKIDHTSSLKLKAITISIKCYVGCEIFTPAVMKGFIFCDTSPCSQLKANSRFEGNFLAASYMLVFCLTNSSTLERRRYIPPKRRLTFNVMHIITF
jgi:hypothetical protein